MSCEGIPSTMATQVLIPASAASIAESAAKAGGTNKIDTSGIPTECLDGFTLNGKRYSIKNNQFVKE